MLMFFLSFLSLVGYDYQENLSLIYVSLCIFLKLVCGICFEAYERDRIKTTGCGHPFCNVCWTTYISTSINDGPGCLSLRCPHPSCGVAIGVSMVNILASDEDKKKYHHYLLRSYIEGNKKVCIYSHNAFFVLSGFQDFNAFFINVIDKVVSCSWV